MYTFVKSDVYLHSITYMTDKMSHTQFADTMKGVVTPGEREALQIELC